MTFTQRETTRTSGSAPAVGTLRLVAGIGGPVGITTDGRSAPARSGEWVSFRYGLAPDGLATKRQLAARGLRPGGAAPVAQLTWRHGPALRVAYLYDVTAAAPKRPMTAAKTAALAKAMLARRTCPACARDAGYCIPRSLGTCLDCHDGPAPVLATQHPDTTPPPKEFSR